ncbi:MAG: ribonuclease HII [bacterium]|nr:ribonuclease HII [bacterium]
MKFLIGVDEAGRGPLAGPVGVGVVIAPKIFNIKKAFPGVADSKVLSAKKREEIYKLLQQAQREKTLRYIVVFASARVIDDIGITKAVRRAVYRGVRTLAPRNALGAPITILLDGLLHAPPEYKQQTIIHGDATEPIISLASIAAKVCRDALMRTAAKKYPEYGFEVNKGYGTKKHYAALRRHGLCVIHRKSFCKNTRRR